MVSKLGQTSVSVALLTLLLPRAAAAEPAAAQPRLWTTYPVSTPVAVRHNGTHLVMENSLVSRIWRVDLGSGLLHASVLRVDAGCYDCDGEDCDSQLKPIPCAANLYGGNGTSPEGAVLVNGRRSLIGGGQLSGAETWRFTGFTVGEPLERFGWVSGERYSERRPWPPLGKSLELHFALPCEAAGGTTIWPTPEAKGGVKHRRGLAANDVASATIRYELYQGIPGFGKYLQLNNTCPGTSLTLFNLTSVFHQTSDVPSGFGDSFLKGDNPLSESWTDVYGHSHGGFFTATDEYTGEQVRKAVWPGVNGTYANSSLTGPGVTLAPGEVMNNFWVFEMLYQTSGNARHHHSMEQLTYARMVTPQMTEAPTIMWLGCAGPANYSCYSGAGKRVIADALEQAVAVGFDMIEFSNVLIPGMSFPGPSFDGSTGWNDEINIESTNDSYVDWFRDVVTDADARGVEMMIYNHGVFEGWDAQPGEGMLNPYDGTYHGSCAASSWFDRYNRSTQHFLNVTGFHGFDCDGCFTSSTPCGNHSHEYHHGIIDSEYQKWHLFAQLYYEWSRKRVGHLQDRRMSMTSGTACAWQFGCNQFPGGYDEMWSSLPRDEWILLTRQAMYNGSLSDTPNSARMYIVPLISYHLQPGQKSLMYSNATLDGPPGHGLDEHLAEYDAALSNIFGYGMRIWLHGWRLYTSERSKAVLTKWTTWNARFRDILRCDVMPVRYPTGTNWDAAIHVASKWRYPEIAERALAVMWNPTGLAITVESMELPLLFTGLDPGQVVVCVISEIGAEQSAQNVSVNVTANTTVILHRVRLLPQSTSSVRVYEEDGTVMAGV